MISLEDCIALSGLTSDEVAALAEHEHISEMAAAAMADYLLHRDKGPHLVREMIRDDIRAAIAKGDAKHARELVAALAHFLREHPEAVRT